MMQGAAGWENWSLGALKGFLQALSRLENAPAF